MHNPASTDTEAVRKVCIAVAHTSGSAWCTAHATASYHPDSCDATSEGTQCSVVPQTCHANSVSSSESHETAVGETVSSLAELPLVQLMLVVVYDTWPVRAATCAVQDLDDVTLMFIEGLTLLRLPAITACANIGT